jgi:hypothetical protein
MVNLFNGESVERIAVIFGNEDGKKVESHTHFTLSFTKDEHAGNQPDQSIDECGERQHAQPL